MGSLPSEKVVSSSGTEKEAPKLAIGEDHLQLVDPVSPNSL